MFLPVLTVFNDFKRLHNEKKAATGEKFGNSSFCAKLSSENGLLSGEIILKQRNYLLTRKPLIRHKDHLNLPPKNLRRLKKFARLSSVALKNQNKV